VFSAVAYNYDTAVSIVEATGGFIIKPQGVCLAVFLLIMEKPALLRLYIHDPNIFICGETTMTTISDLTPRELEILQLVLAGYTNKAIATQIYVTEKTVEFHLDHIYTKIGVRTRLLAGIWALQQGIEI